MNEHSFITRTRSPIGVREKNDKYKRILEAAVKVFARQGFFQSTVSQIAREAGVADGTIYLYFKNKDDIMVQFCSYKMKQVFEGFRTQVDLAETAPEKMRLLIRRHLEEFQRNPDMAIVYLAEIHQLRRLTEVQIKAMSDMYNDIISEIVEQGQADGTIRRDLYIGLVKRLILGAVNEVISTWLHSGCKYDLLSMADPLVALFFSGIGQAPPLHAEAGAPTQGFRREQR